MKTVKTRASVKGFIDAIEDETRRSECRRVLKMMREITGCTPRMWGDSIVGFDEYEYQRADGKTYQFFRTGFSPRKTALTLYIMPGYSNLEAWLKKLGPHKKGKSCLYLKRLSDVDEAVLMDLITAGYEDMELRYPR